MEKYLNGNGSRIPQLNCRASCSTQILQKTSINYNDFVNSLFYVFKIYQFLILVSIDYVIGAN